MRRPIELRKDSRQYVKMYLFVSKDEKMVKQLIIERFTHLGQVKLFSYIAVHCNKETMRWNIDKTNRAEIIERFGIGDSTLNKYLSEMSGEKIGALRRLSKGSYEVNKEFVDTGFNNI